MRPRELGGPTLRPFLGPRSSAGRCRKHWYPFVATHLGLAELLPLSEPCPGLPQDLGQARRVGPARRPPGRPLGLAGGHV
eukprot:1808540-Alexandrium_andersonii.AAC.1